MANDFDTSWNSAYATEKSVFGGESVQSGSTTYSVVVLEFERAKVIGASAGHSFQLTGQVVIDREDWQSWSGGRNSVRGFLRGQECRFELAGDSPDVDGVVLNIRDI